MTEEIDSQIQISNQQMEKAETDLSQQESQLRDLKNREQTVQSQLSNNDSNQRLVDQRDAESRAQRAIEIQQKIQQMQSKIRSLQQENGLLMEQQQMKNSTIGEYISEMSTMLSSAEFESALALEHVDTESDDEIDNDEPQFEELDFDDTEEIRPHAGTGGSSKLRSRPQNNLHNLAGGAAGQQNHGNRARRQTNNDQQMYQQQNFGANR